MEEDIKNIERVIDYIQLESPIIQGLGNAIYTDSLKRLIKVYRELEERNSVLNESNNLKINKINELEKENQSYRDYLGEPPCYDNAKYIPKSKVKEKLEELEKKNKKNRK